MLPITEIRNTLQHLHDATTRKKVKWTKTPASVEGYRTSKDALIAEFPNSVVQLMFLQPTVDPDFFRVEFKNKDGESVACWDVDADSEGFETVKDLYMDAYRVATGWDKILADINQSLESIAGEPAKN